MSAYLADLVLIAHASFVIFVVLGGLLCYRWPKAAWVHLPAAAWGVFVELAGWICPLTYLEDYLRGQPSERGCVDRILMPILYPQGLTSEFQMLLGLGVLVLNACIYGPLLRRARRSRTA